MIAILLALASSVAYGLSDFLGGTKSRTLPQLSVLLISQASALLLLVAIVIVGGGEPPGGRFILSAALAGIAEAVAVAALYRGLAIESISIVAPIAPPHPSFPSSPASPSDRPPPCCRTAASRWPSPASSSPPAPAPPAAPTPTESLPASPSG